MATTPEGITMEAALTFGALPTRTWQVTAGRISGFTDGLSAMGQAVEIALHVRRFYWQIYSPQVGHQLEIVGNDFGTARVHLQTCIWEALSADDRITGVSDFQFSQDGDGMAVSFVVHTVFGNVSAEVSV